MSSTHESNVEQVRNVTFQVHAHAPVMIRSMLMLKKGVWIARQGYDGVKNEVKHT